VDERAKIARREWVHADRGLVEKQHAGIADQTSREM
jgi:hypothetical protein